MKYELKLGRSWIESHQTKSGKESLSFRQSYFDELTHKWRKKSKKILKDTPQARKKAQNTIVKEIQKQYEQFDSIDCTLGELKNRYFNYLDKGASGMHYQTCYQYESHINQLMEYVSNPDIVANEVTVTFLHKYFTQLFVEGKSWSYINVRRAAIANMFQYGVDNGYCTSNPLVGYRLKRKPPVKLEEVESKYFTPDELRAILSYYRNQGRDDIADFFEFLYLTGMRFSEGASLYPQDVFKPEDGTYFCKVDGTQILIHNNGKPPRPNWTTKGHKNVGLQQKNLKKQNSTKSDSGMRFVKLEPAAIEIYKRHKNSNRKYLFTIQTKPAPGLKHDHLGNAFQFGSLNRNLKFAAKKVGINKKLTTHFFRHTYVSREASYGTSFDYDFIRQIGHKEAKLTHSIYDHINTINHDKLRDGYKKIDEDILLHKL